MAFESVLQEKFLYTMEGGSVCLHLTRAFTVTNEIDQGGLAVVATVDFAS